LNTRVTVSSTDSGDEGADPAPTRGSGTAWVRRGRTPVVAFLRTATGSAVVLLAATAAALIWANVDAAGYRQLWSTELSVSLGDATLGQDLRGWVNSGLMSFFFLVVGLEARREFDLGELRERRQLVLPVVAGLAGMAVPVAVYLAVNAGGAGAVGWGTAMSTDTAFALGVLALLGRRVPEVVRTFILTVSVVDDLCALAVIALVYSADVRPAVVVLALAILVVVVVGRALGVRHGIVYFLLGLAAWTTFHESGVDPVVVGLAMGLLMYARPAERADLERASDLFRLFREQPTAELARSARAGLWTAISPNDRLQQLYHPWTGYLVVPLFALANAGITLDRSLVSSAVASPITWGIVLGYGIGKPLGVAGGSWLTTRMSHGRLRPGVGWVSVGGAGTIAGIGFTVSLLVATLAFEGQQLAEAKLGILAAAAWSSAVTWLLFRIVSLLPKRTRIRSLLGVADPLVDLAVPVTDERDHIRGPVDAPVTLVEYGDFECPYCGQAEPVVRELLAEAGDVRYVWRHLPLTDVHPHAQQAAEAAEAAAEQGAFWAMHDLLFDRQDALTRAELAQHAAQLGLDVPQFLADLRRGSGAARVAADVESADLSAVSGTPTFFVNGRRHYGAYDIEALSTAVRLARARVTLAPSSAPGP
jgi:Na+/H+ antiporter NhaA